MDSKPKLKKYGAWSIIVEILFAVDAIINISTGKETGLDYLALVLACSFLILNLVYYWHHRGDKIAEEPPIADDSNHKT